MAAIFRRWRYASLAGLLLLLGGLLTASQAQIVVWPGPGEAAPGGGVAVSDSPLTWTGLNTWQRAGGITGHTLRYSSIGAEVGESGGNISGLLFDKLSTDTVNSPAVSWAVGGVRKWAIGSDVQTTNTEQDMVLLWDQTYGAGRTGTDVFRVSPHAGTTTGIKMQFGDTVNSPATNIALLRLGPSGASSKHLLQLDSANFNQFSLILANTSGGTHRRGHIVFGAYNTGTNVLTQHWWLATDLPNNNTQNFFIYDAVAAAARLTIDSNGRLTTGAPAGGTAAGWKFGTVATVTATAPNRTIELEVNGTRYFVHAKTTND